VVVKCVDGNKLFFSALHSDGVFEGHLHGWAKNTKTEYLNRHQYVLIRRK
jgi:hypothetical protein